MKLLVSAGFAVCACIALLTLATGQDSSSELKHTVVPLEGSRGVSLAALSIERGAKYPSMVSLKGNVEVKVPVCVPAGKHGKQICDGYTVVRADEAQVHEDTGEIEANGHVRITPLRHKQ